ncbi:hypothetical protein EJB05_56181, partial [Eragrostis curvula]
MFLTIFEFDQNLAQKNPNMCISVTQCVCNTNDCFAQNVLRRTIIVTKNSVTQVMELDSNSAKENKKTRIILRHILLAIRNDEELGRLLAGINIAHDVFCPTSTRCCSPRRPWRRHPAAEARRLSLPRRHTECHCL